MSVGFLALYLPLPSPLLTPTQLFDKKFPTKKTGLEPGFHGHPYVAEQFIKAHAALQELAKFVQIIIKVNRRRANSGANLREQRDEIW
jgi:hypothetical protein